VYGAAMGAIKPWQLLICVFFVVLVVGGLLAVIRAARRK
jgi:hypothetical protein